MKFIRFAAAAALALSLSACATWDALVTSGPAAAVASVADGYVPPSVAAPVANSVLAAEGFYASSGNVIAKAISRGDLSKAAVDRIDPIEARVYAALVAARKPAAAGQDATAALATFNAAYADLFKEASADGVALSATANGGN